MTFGQGTIKQAAVALLLSMNHQFIRPTAEADIDAVMAMYDYSRGLMRASGNRSQWVGYPTRDNLLDDMRRSASFVIADAEGPVGTFALVPGIEPTYGFIDHGRWIDSATPYVTLHRLAKSPRGRGVAQTAFAEAKRRFAHLRADTHGDNHTMRRLLAREDFVECGTVYMDDGSPRLAYEWWRWDTVPADLQRYVQRYVLPRYEAFDAAHRRDHALRVMARAMRIEADRQVYVAAAMHDLGLAYGREGHHLASGRIVRRSQALPRWFSNDEVELIAQAVEDHRASASRPPRSPLGCIIAEADRDVEPERIVRRTVEYSLDHYPALDRRQHWKRTLEHLHEKYAEGGYIRLWMDHSPNAEPLAELRALIADEARLHILFDRLFDSLAADTEKQSKP